MWPQWKRGGGFGNWLGGVADGVRGAVSNGYDGVRSVQFDLITGIGLAARGLEDIAGLVHMGSHPVQTLESIVRGVADRANAIRSGDGEAAAKTAIELASVLMTRGATGAARAPILLNPPILITTKGLQHVVERHTHSGIAKFASKSKFNAGEDIQSLIWEGTQQPMVLQANGRFARTFNAGRDIGLDRATGYQTRWMTIVTEADGTLVTAFPGVP